jgi:pyruvate/2-oxoglutarate dehydrogenase complex dihydrolipoamide acyltransferase (E2) component
MPVRDEERWKQNEDGSWSRKSLSELEEAPYDDSPNATAGALEAAEELGVDLSTVTGTGKDGKITKADVTATVEEE